MLLFVIVPMQALGSGREGPNISNQFLFPLQRSYSLAQNSPVKIESGVVPTKKRKDESQKTTSKGDISQPKETITEEETENTEDEEEDVGAANVKQAKKTNLKGKKNGKGPEATGISLWLGIDAGPVFIRQVDSAIESPKNGYILGISAHISLIAPRTTIEVGGGWSNTRVFSAGKTEANLERDVETGISTAFGTLEFDARFRPSGGRFEIGPAVLVTFGTDSTFSPVPELSSNNTKPNVYIGLQMLMGNSLESNTNNRYGMSLVSDVSITDRQIYFVTLQYALGVPLVSSKTQTKIRTKTRTKTIIREKILTETKVVTKTKIVNVPQNIDRYILDAGFINFQTNKFEIDPLSMRYLQELGKFLAQNRKLWTGISIRSNTDRRGSSALNTQLSTDRAQAAVNILTAQGIEGTDIYIKSQSYNDPVEAKDDEVSLARNRRIEVEIIGAREILGLKGKIAKIQQKYRVPSTCNGTGCN
jgi:outer membrane protein OmpA-like peptidoglycan-associated protein